MGTKGKFTLFILLVLLASGGIFYIQHFYFAEKPMPTYHALPESSFLVVQSNHFSGFSEKWQKHPIHEAFLASAEYKSLLKDWEAFEQEVFNQENKSFFEPNAPMFMSLSNRSVRRLSLLFLVPTVFSDAETFESHLESQYGAEFIHKRKFKKDEVFDIEVPSGQSFSCCFLNGTLIFSTSSVMVEDGVRAYRKRNSKNELRKIITKNEHDEEAIYLNYHAAPRFIGTFISKSYHDFLQPLSDIGHSGYYQLLSEEEILSLRGNIYSSDSAKSYINLFKGQKPGTFEAAEVMPARTAAFAHYQINSFHRFLDRLEAKHRESGTYNSYQFKFDSIEQENNLRIRTDFVPIMGKAFTLAVNEPVSDNFSDQMYVVVGYENVLEAVDLLDSLNKRVEADQLSTTTPIEYRDFKVSRMAFKGIFPLLFPQLLQDMEQPFYVKLGKHLVFASKMTQIQRIVDEYLSEQLLSGSLTYSSFTQHLASESNFYFYINPARAHRIPRPFLDPAFKEAFSENLEQIRSFDAFGFQITAIDKHFYNQITLKKGKEKSTTTELIWKQKLDGVVKRSPQIVDKAGTKEKELLVIDEQSRFYLLNASGSILWKKALEQPILGRAAQIDYYQNEKLQYLFATSTHLQLLDRNGKDVANYPIRLGAKAVSGVVAFDFDQNGKVKIFIGCENNSIYGYHANGKPLEGWSPKRLDGNIGGEVKYFKSRNKAYLLAHSNKGTLYVWDDKGKEIFTPVKMETQFKNPFKIRFGYSFKETYLTSVDTAGLTHFVYMDGKHETKQIGDGWGKGVFFDYLDFSANGEKEFILAEDQRIVAYDKKGDVYFSVNAAAPLVYPPDYPKFFNGHKIAYVSPETDQLFLVNRLGQFYRGFPLKGSSPFTIGNVNLTDEKELLVVDNEGFLRLYRIGY